MKNILVMSLAILLGIAGCTESKRCISSSESIECQRLRLLWEHSGEENPQVIIPEIETEFGHESGDEMTWQELGEIVFSTVGCCFCKSHPLAKEWMEYNRLECIREYLEKENIQRIAFYVNVMDEDRIKPEDWHSLWAEIVEPKRIREAVKIFCKAMKKESDRFSNEEIVLGHYDRMQIITDKHKLIIPIGCGSDGSKAIRGVGWTSYELRKRLKEWGFPEPKKAHSDIGRSSIQEDADTLAPHVRTIEKQTLELIAQHAWLKASLNKCIEKLEIEKGLEPMPFDMYQHLDFPKLKRGPNAAKRYTEKQQKFFVPYQGPNQPSLSASEHQDIRILTALLRLQCNSIEMYMAGSRDWIANFEKRLKRLEDRLKE